MEDDDSIQSWNTFSNGLINIKKIDAHIASQKAPMNRAPIVAFSELAILASRLLPGYVVFVPVLKVNVKVGLATFEPGPSVVVCSRGSRLCGLDQHEAAISRNSDNQVKHAKDI